MHIVTAPRALTLGTCPPAELPALPVSLGAADQRAAALARWGGRLWMGAVLLGVLLVILAAVLVAPLRALISE